MFPTITKSSELNWYHCKVDCCCTDKSLIKSLVRGEKRGLLACCGYNNETVNGGNNEITALPPLPNLIKRLSEFLISAAFSINPYLYVVLILSWIRKDNNENPIFQPHTKGMPSVFNHAVEILAAFSEPSFCSNYISRF